MRFTKKILLFSVALMVLLFSGAGRSVTAQAAAKKGLVKSGGKYYYYKNGRKVVNTWKTIKQKKVKYKFYFNKKGVACKAPAAPDKSYNVKLFKIGKKKYGFDSKAHRVNKGIYVDKKSKLYVFKSKGVYDSKSTTALRTTFKRGRDGGQRSADLLEQVKAAFGTPLSEKRYTGSCSGWNLTEPFTDIILTYKYFEVDLVYNEDTHLYWITDFYSLQVK